jgi:hypothetical protein
MPITEDPFADPFGAGCIMSFVDDEFDKVLAKAKAKGSSDSMFGFSTASGAPVKINPQAVMRVMGIFSD